MHSLGGGGIEADQPLTDGAHPASPDDSWWAMSQMVERVLQGSPGGMEELYNFVLRTAERHFCREFSAQECKDQVHDLYLVVVEVVRGGALRDPRRLKRFVRTMVRSQTFAEIRRASLARRGETASDDPSALPDRGATPRRKYLQNEDEALLRIAFGVLSPVDREILVHFYLAGSNQRAPW